ncbi:MAG: hypothetical protein M3P84_05950 [Chloroflexota bacterium]|nr:hypothetical protein [Chloroflexota bacterium]
MTIEHPRWQSLHESAILASQDNSAREDRAIGGVTPLARPDTLRSRVATRLSDGRAGLQALLLYLIGAFIVTWDAWSAPTTRWIGGCCDPEQTIWFVRWVPYAIGHGVDPLITYQLNAPDGVNLMWNTSILAWSLIATPVTLLAGPIFAYNVLMLGAIVASALAARLVVARYVEGSLAPLVGGVVYGFSPYVISHASLHFDLAMAWLPPLVLLVFDDLLVRRTHSARRLGVVLGLLGLLQLFTTEEILATTAISGLLVLAILAVQRRSQIRAVLPRLATALAWAAATLGILGAWPLAVQFLGPGRITNGLIDLREFSTDLLNLVVPTSFQLFAPAEATRISSEFSVLFHEAGAYLGLPLIVVLAVIVVVGRRDVRVRTAAAGGLAILVLSMGGHLVVGGTATGIPLPWLLASGVPILENIVASRFIVFTWLAVAILVGFGIERAMQAPIRRAAPRLAVLGLALLVVLPAPLRSTTNDVPAFFARWAQQGMRPDATILFAPFFRNGAGADPMLWAAIAGDEPRMVEAYAYVPRPDGRAGYGPNPTQLFSIMQAIQDSPSDVAIVARAAVRDQVAADIRAKGITDVIVGPMVRTKPMIAFFSDLFGRPPEAVDGVWIWRAVDTRGVTPAP